MASVHHHHRLPEQQESSFDQRQRRRRTRPWEEEDDEPPPAAAAPSLTRKGPQSQLSSSFVISEANDALFNEVLSNCSRLCRIGLAAPGLYSIAPENTMVGGGHFLLLEGLVDGVTLQPLQYLAIYTDAKLVLRRVTVDSANKVFPHSGCLQVRGGNVEAYNTTFRHNVGLNCAGVACVSDPDASFLASSCIFEHNVCEEILGAGAITVDGRGAEGAAPWVTLDRCTFYENSCNGGGGAVKAYGRGSLSITNSVFIGQQARGFGGAVFASCETNTDPEKYDPPRLRFTPADLSVTIRGCQFYRNEAIRNLYTWGGGAIYSRANLTLANSAFYYNQVQPIIGETEKDIAIGGGALFNDGVMRGSDLHFEANEAARMGGAVLLARGSAILSRCTFVENAAGNQGGALFINGTSRDSSLPPSTDPSSSPSMPGALVKDSVFRGNRVTGFPAPYYPFANLYTMGGGALGVWGPLLVHNSSFEDNVAQASESLQGDLAHVDGRGSLQLSFCSFSFGGGHGRHKRRQGLRPRDLHLAASSSAAAPARCVGTYAENGRAAPALTTADAANASAAGLGAAQCFIGQAGGGPWSAPALWLLLALPLAVLLYTAFSAAHHIGRAHPQVESLKEEAREKAKEADEADDMQEEWSDDEEDGPDDDDENRGIQSSGYNPAATFPVPSSGIATMWRFLRGEKRRRRATLNSQPQQESPLSSLLPSQQQYQEQKASCTHGADGTTRATGPEQQPGADRGGEEEDEDEEVLDWRKTMAYRLSLGTELRDPSKPWELRANHLEAFTLEGRGRNAFRVTDPQPLTHSRFGRLYFARNTGDGGDPCLMLIYNRFKHEAATLVTEKEMLHTGSSISCPFLLRHLDDFFHARVGYYVALTPACRETLYQRLRRAATPSPLPQDAMDLPTIARYLHEILQGLGALRDLRMVHGRLSLHAVLLTHDDHVRLWNYGVPPSAAIRRPDKPTVFSAPEVWDMLRMNPTPVSSMDSWSAGVVGYMLAARALAVTLPPCAPCYRGETYVDYFEEYLQRHRRRRGGSYYYCYDGDGALLDGNVAVPPLAPEPYFPSLPSVDPAIREEDLRDHGGALVTVLSRLLDVNANRRLSLEVAELKVRQIVQRALLLARTNVEGRGGGEGDGGQAHVSAVSDRLLNDVDKAM